eukprot:1189249-Prorocentrum_minimum.AAC.2
MGVVPRMTDDGMVYTSGGRTNVPVIDDDVVDLEVRGKVSGVNAQVQVHEGLTLLRILRGRA